MSTTTVNLGYVPKNRGEYSSTASYYKDNIVQYNGSSYICNPPNYDPDTAPTASVTGVAPYDSDPAVPNTGWAVFCNDSSGVGEGVYNVSVDHTTDNNPKVYVSLSAALQDIPQAKKKGGMEIRFILNNSDYAVDKEEGITTQPAGTAITSSPTMVDGTYKASQLVTYFSTLPTATGAGNAVVYYKEVDGTYTTWTITLQSSDNKYVQFRYMSPSTAVADFINVDNWQGVDDEPIAGSKNLVTSGGVAISANPKVSGIDTSDADLDVTDSNFKSIVRLKDGHIKTKNFDSSADATTINRGLMSSQDKSKLDTVENGAEVNNTRFYFFDDEHSDLDISDANLKAIVQFKDGHIKTKNFDSKAINIDSVPLAKGLLQSNINPFGITASKFFVKAAKRTYLENFYPLIIVAGQSNADGRVPFDDADTPQWLIDANYSVSNYEVWDTASKTFQTYNVKGMSGNGGNIAGSDGTGTNKYAFDPFFAHAWLETFGGKLYMVRQTLGGIGIQSQPTTGTRPWTWQPDVDNIIDGCHSMCLGLMDKVKEAMDYAKEQGIKLYPLCILWHQGENDANNNDIQYFKQNLSNLIMWLRGMMLTPSLPFICGELMDTHVTSTEDYHRANVIMSELAETDDYMQLVSMAGHYTGLTGGDIHFSSEAIQYMGAQMFNEIQKYI